MIKQKKPLKLYFGKTLKTIGMIAVMASCFAGCKNPDPSTSAEKPVILPNDTQPIYVQTHALPTQEETMDRLIEIYGDESKMYLLKDQIIRFPCPVDQEKIQINFEFKPTITQKIIFEEAISDYNEFFSVINPNYQFEINYTPTEQDLLNPYSIDIQKVEKIENSPSVLGQAHVPHEEKSNEIDGFEIYNSSIKITEYTLKGNLELTQCFNHELGHILGAGDAYANPNATTNTVMQSYRYSNKVFTPSKVDVAFFDALYRDPNNTKTEEEINEYIKNYTSPTNQEIINYINQKVIERTSVEDLNTIMQKKQYLISCLKENIFGYKQEILDDLIKKLKTIDFNSNFGKNSVCFGEISLENRDRFKEYHYCKYKASDNYISQYFYNIRASENYYNANQDFRTVSSSGKTSNGIIVDLYYNQYVYINIDKYVLEIELFELKTDDGKNLDEKGVKLNAVYQLTDKTPEEYFENVFTKTTIKEEDLEKQN